MESRAAVQSIAFQQCVGVFEGGGVRGAAFAGVYEAATAAGIEFCGTAGTSAGSIAAAFIAACMPPELATKKLTLGFSDLLDAPEPPQKIFNRMKQGAAVVLGKKASTAAKWNYSLGTYSSRRIEQWVNGSLREFLRAQGDIVYFRDMPRPLAILTSDILSKGPKIFSKKTTPGTSVAFAVRASCSIPFFFQPVVGEGALLVDGGILANLPMFLIDELEVAPATPALCFRLVPDGKSSSLQTMNLERLARDTIETAINGATEIQLSLGPKRYVININTGQIQSTDFGIDGTKVQWLREQGAKAVMDLVENEQIRATHTSGPAVDRVLKGYREGLLERTADLIAKSVGKVTIVAGDLSWFKELHVSLLSAVLRGRSLEIICERVEAGHPDYATYKSGLQAATALGAEITEISETAGIRGIVLPGNAGDPKMLLIEKLPDIHGTVFAAPADAQLIEFVLARLKALKSRGTTHPRGTSPKLSAIPHGDIVSALSTHVPQYAGKRITIDEVPVDRLRPLAKVLETFKLSRGEAMDSLLVEQGISSAARYAGCPWVIGLPVVEQLRNGHLIVIDGTHRAYRALRSLRSNRIRVVLVENADANLPATPFRDWNHIQVRPDKIARDQRYQNFNQSNFRPIRLAFNSLAM